MIQLRHLLLLSAFVLLNSCAFHHGYLSSNAVIVDQNFRVLGVAKGTSETWKVLGFGGVNQDALVYEAKSDLYTRTPLEPGQALTNITVDFKNEFYFVTSNLRVTVTAEIIDFNRESHDQPNNYGKYGFIPGETIYASINGEYVKRSIHLALPSGISVIDPETNERKTIDYSKCYYQRGSVAILGEKVPDRRRNRCSIEAMEKRLQLLL